MRILQAPFLIAALCWLCSCSQKADKEYILNENFDANEIGWPEEFTSSHETEIRDGVYYVHSKTEDTSKLQSSVSPQKISFLFGLPKHYEITTSIKKFNSSYQSERGIILESASLTYRFSLSDSGEVNVTEYDYNTELETSMIDSKYHQSTGRNGTEVIFKIEINGRDLKFYLDDKYIESFKIKNKGWQDIRVFTSTRSGISIDYLRIKKLE